MRGTNSNQGFSLVELVIVVAVIGTLATALGFSYAGWIKGYEVEQQTKNIYSDMMAARLMAMYRSRAYFLDFQDATTYRLIEDTNEDGDDNADGGDTVLPSFPKTLGNTVSVNGSGVPVTFKFTQRGTTTPLRTLRINHSADTDYDCIVVSTTRINMGRFEGGSCEQR